MAVEQRVGSPIDVDGAVVVCSEHDLVVNGKVALAERAEVVAELPGVGEVLAGGEVESVDGAVRPGDEYRILPRRTSRGPSINSEGEHRGRVGDGVDAAMVAVLADGCGDVAVAEFGERGAFPFVVWRRLMVSSATVTVELVARAANPPPAVTSGSW